MTSTKWCQVSVPAPPPTHVRIFVKFSLSQSITTHISAEPPPPLRHLYMVPSSTFSTYFGPFPNRFPSRFARFIDAFLKVLWFQQMFTLSSWYRYRMQLTRYRPCFSTNATSCTAIRPFSNDISKMKNNEVKEYLSPKCIPMQWIFLLL